MKKKSEYQEIDYQKLGDYLIDKAITNPDVFNKILTQIKPQLINISKSLSSPILQTKSTTVTDAGFQEGGTSADDKKAAAEKKSKQTSARKQIEKAKEDQSSTGGNPNAGTETEIQRTYETITKIIKGDPITEVIVDSPEQTITHTRMEKRDLPLPPMETWERNPAVSLTGMNRKEFEAAVDVLYSKNTYRPGNGFSFDEFKRAAADKGLNLSDIQLREVYDATPETPTTYYSPEGAIISKDEYDRLMDLYNNGAVSSSTSTQRELTEEEMAEIRAILEEQRELAKTITQEMIGDGEITEAQRAQAEEDIYNALIDNMTNEDGGSAAVDEVIQNLQDEAPPPQITPGVVGEIIKWFLCNIAGAAMQSIGGMMSSANINQLVDGTIRGIGNKTGEIGDKFISDSRNISEDARRIIMSMDVETTETIADTVATIVPGMIPIPIIPDIINEFIAQGLHVDKGDHTFPNFSFGLRKPFGDVLLDVWRTDDGKIDFVAIAFQLVDLASTIITAGGAAAGKVAAASANSGKKVGVITDLLGKMNNKLGKSANKFFTGVENLNDLDKLGLSPAELAKRKARLTKFNKLIGKTSKNRDKVKKSLGPGGEAYINAIKSGNTTFPPDLNRLTTAVKFGQQVNRSGQTVGGNNNPEQKREFEQKHIPGGSTTTTEEDEAPGMPYTKRSNLPPRPQFNFPEGDPIQPPVEQEEYEVTEEEVIPAVTHEETYEPEETVEETIEHITEVPGSTEAPVEKKQTSKNPPYQRAPTPKKVEESLPTTTTSISESFPGLETPGEETGSGGIESAKPITDLNGTGGDYFGTARMLEAINPVSFVNENNTYGSGVGTQLSSSSSSPIDQSLSSSTQVLTDNNNSINQEIETQPFKSEISDKAINGLWITPRNNKYILSDEKVKNLAAIRINNKLFDWRKK